MSFGALRGGHRPPMGGSYYYFESLFRHIFTSCLLFRTISIFARPTTAIMTPCNYLPLLPFEYLLEILSQVHARYIFSFRQVSQAWHAMLSNPNLEAALMALYPFLTTAPTLASLTKCRPACLVMSQSPSRLPYGIPTVKDKPERYIWETYQFHKGCEIVFANEPWDDVREDKCWNCPYKLEVVDRQQGGRRCLR